MSLGDEEGIRAYTKNLDTIGTFDMPANDRTDAKVTVVFRNEQEDTLTLDELRTVRGKVKWKVRGRTPAPITVRTRGSALGGVGLGVSPKNELK